MKILVTGANGYLGQGVVKCLLDKGLDVVATDFDVKFVDKRATCIAGNIFEIDNPFEFFGKPEAVLHLAWKDGFVHYSDSHMTELPNHYLFLKKMITSGIKKVTVMGSVHEIGFYEGSVDENTPCWPTTPYGISKNALREVTRMLAQQNNVSFQWLRGYYIVGHSEFGSSIFSKITAAEKEGKKEFPFTLGQNQFDFIDYEAFCEQVASVVSQDNVNGIINICSGYPEKLADRVERFIDENNYSIKLKYGAFPDRPYDSKAIWGNNKKIMKILGQETK